MKYGRNKTKTMVAIKIAFVWVVSLSICIPVCILGFIDNTNLYNDGACVPTLRDFIIYGSIFAFYVPLTIMVITYVLTIQILCDNQRLMRSIVKDHSKKAKLTRKEKNGTQNNTYLSPNVYLPRFMDRPSVDVSLSMVTSVNDTSLPTGSHSILESPKEEKNNSQLTESLLASVELTAEVDVPTIGAEVEVRKISPSPTSGEEACSTNSNPNIPNTITTSQSHLSGNFSPLSSPCGSRHNLLLPRTSSKLSIGHSPVMSRASSRCSIGQHSMLSYQGSRSSINFSEPCLSPASSLNSMLSQAHYGSAVFSDFGDSEIAEKLSQIEQEMDDVLKESGSMDGESGGGGSGVSSPQDMEMNDDSPEPDSEEKLLETGQSDDSPEEQHLPRLTVPPVTVTSPPLTSSDDTLDDSDSDNSDLITIHLKATGCYLYKLNPNDSGLLSCSSKLGVNDLQTPNGPAQSFIPKQDATDHSADELDDHEDSYSYSLSTSMSTSVNKKYQTKNNSRGHGNGWKAFMRRSTKKFKRKQLIKVNGAAFANVISKRTASNEKKASKVLGIIFAVFVILWTPFFIVNVLSVVCEPCMEAMTPAMMAAIVWLGYLSSLANPIIYTMFNTAFRRAFFKIITCRYKHSNSTHDTVHMTNANRWGSDRRNTLTLTLREY